jgi:hypothetical protein
MPLPHMRVVVVALGILKAATVVGSVLGVALFTLNPNIVIALIVSAPGMATVVLAILTRRDNRRAELARANDHAVTMGVMTKVKEQTDGLLTAKTAELANVKQAKDEQATQLSETAQKLSHAEGVQQERVDERGRQNDAK